MCSSLTAESAPSVKIREPDKRLTLEEQLKILEEWAFWMFYLSCCPLEH